MSRPPIHTLPGCPRTGARSTRAGRVRAAFFHFQDRGIQFNYDPRVHTRDLGTSSCADVVLEVLDRAYHLPFDWWVGREVRAQGSRWLARRAKDRDPYAGLDALRDRVGAPYLGYILTHESAEDADRTTYLEDPTSRREWIRTARRFYYIVKQFKRAGVLVFRRIKRGERVVHMIGLPRWVRRHVRKLLENAEDGNVVGVQDIYDQILLMSRARAERVRELHDVGDRDSLEFLLGSDLRHYREYQRERLFWFAVSFVTRGGGALWT